MDLIITNVNEYKSAVINKLAPIAGNDHCVIQMEPPTQSRPKYITRSKHMVTQKAKALITLDICKQTWSEVYETADINDKVERYHNIINDIFTKHCPKRNVKVRAGKPLLENPVTIKLRRLKDKLYKNGKSDNGWKNVGKTLTSKYRDLQRSFAQNNINKVATGSKKWWKGVNSIVDPSSANSNVNQQKRFIEGKWMDDKEFVEKQHEYYLSLATPLPQSQTDDHDLSTQSEQSEVNVAEIYTKLRQINTAKSTHSKDFPSWISKNNAESLCFPLAHIINAAIPEKHSEYRPIPLLWHCSKILEYFVTKNIDAVTLKSNQYAYTTGKGCTDALVNFITDTAFKLDRQDVAGIHTLLIDYSKAFDNMDHQLLIDKMINMGINQNTISITRSFLSNRTARVVIRQSNTQSTSKPVEIGVPQGSLLGPVLWNLFVDNMPDKSATLIKYADDTTAYTTITKQKSSTLQAAADDITDWSSENHLTLNTSKTKTMIFNLRTQTDLPPITINDNEIETVETFRLLGVIIDTRLSFAAHVENLVNTCRSKCHGLTKMKRYGVAKRNLIHAYQANILSVAKYAAPAWFPYITNNSKEHLETIQRLALKIIYPELESYEQRLTISKLERLADDLEMMCILYAQKKADMHQNVLPKKDPEIRRSKRLSSRNSDVIKHNTTKASNSLFIKYGNLLH